MRKRCNGSAGWPDGPQHRPTALCSTGALDQIIQAFSQKAGFHHFPCQQPPPHRPGGPPIILRISLPLLYSPVKLCKLGLLRCCMISSSSYLMVSMFLCCFSASSRRCSLCKIQGRCLALSCDKVLDLMRTAASVLQALALIRNPNKLQTAAGPVLPVYSCVVSMTGGSSIDRFNPA